MSNYTDIILQYYDTLYMYAMRLYKDEESAEDAVQDLYLKFFSKKLVLRYQNSEKDEITNVLRIALRNAFYDHLRKNRDKTKVDIENCKPFRQEIEADHAIREKEFVKNLFNIKRMKLRRVVFFLIKGYSYDDIAERLNTTNVNVRGLVHLIRHDELINQLRYG